MDENVLFGTLLWALSCGKADAQEPKMEAYVCKVEFTGGVAYDVGSKELAKHDISAER